MRGRGGAPSSRGAPTWSVPAWRARRSHSPRVAASLRAPRFPGFLRIFDPTVPRVPGRQNRFSRRAPGRLGLGLREASLWSREERTPGCPARSLLARALFSLALSAHLAPRTSRSASALPSSAPPLSRRRRARPAVGGAGGERRRPLPLSPPRKGAGLADHPRALSGTIWTGRSAPGNWDPSGVRQEYWLFPGTLLRQLAPLSGVSPASYAPLPQGNCPRVASSLPKQWASC